MDRWGLPTGVSPQCAARPKELAALDTGQITFAMLSGGRKRRLEQSVTKD